MYRKLGFLVNRAVSIMIKPPMITCKKNMINVDGMEINFEHNRSIHNTFITIRMFGSISRNNSFILYFNIFLFGYKLIIIAKSSRIKQVQTIANTSFIYIATANNRMVPTARLMLINCKYNLLLPIALYACIFAVCIGNSIVIMQYNCKNGTHPIHFSPNNN